VSTECRTASAAVSQAVASDSRQATTHMLALTSIGARRLVVGGGGVGGLCHCTIRVACSRGSRVGGRAWEAAVRGGCCKWDWVRPRFP